MFKTDTNTNANANTDFVEDPTFSYKSPCMRCQPIIDYTSIQYNIFDEAFPFKLFSDPEWKFGVFNLHIRPEIPITSKHLHLFFTIDSSGSMSDVCSDGLTKMQHIHYTLENMINIFYETPNCNISIHIQSFDTDIEKHIQDVSNIKEENLELMINKIQQIIPKGSTNIELALNSASQQINEYSLNNLEHEIIHLFLTDGKISDGTSDKEVLKNMLPTCCSNIFIGYGLEHDSQLLSFLGNTKNNDYRFIDALNKAGLVYGEIIHGILYKAITDVTIKTYGCEIYNFQTNNWSDELFIGNLLSEQKKTYHIRSKTQETCYIIVLGKTIIQTKQFQILHQEIEKQAICHPILSLFETKLDIFMFRQRTQELLYEAKTYSEKNNLRRIQNRLSIFSRFKNNEETITSEESLDNEESIKLEKTTIKTKLSEFRTLMLNYMKDTQIETNPIMKMLCDDIYICIRTIGTSLDNMFSCARQSSQGRQQTYACSQIDSVEPESEPSVNYLNPTFPSQLPIFNYLPPATRLARHSNNIGLSNYEIDEIDEIDNGLLSQNTLTPYYSSGVVKLMREVSGDDTIGQEDNTQIIH